MAGLGLGGGDRPDDGTGGQLDSIFGGLQGRRGDNRAAPDDTARETATEPDAEPSPETSQPATTPDADGMSRLWAIESQLRLLDARVRRMGAQIERLLVLVAEQNGAERRAAPRVGDGVQPHLLGRRADDHADDPTTGGGGGGPTTDRAPDQSQDVGPMFRR